MNCAESRLRSKSKRTNQPPIDAPTLTGYREPRRHKRR
ncbi:hypothetical protein [Klebsiella phage vB_KpnS-VAC2]|uniref:Uncharacterized protein n=1 Tax=Klebsiella phage vB_KpnS-VAC2 TaxID=2864369 RepID=A0AAE7XHP7_9CAUD|nr:hypothetical protein [Klebsiella phage vB_KpnS-VAC2]